jgi:hypothetical protein
VKKAWHALFAPLPQDAVVRRKPVLSPELAERPESAAVAGWETLSVELSAGPAGLRHAMVVLDASGTPISAGDWVMYCSGKPIEYVHENVGGRLQPDGTFLGTRWRTVAVEIPGSDEAETKETVQSDPSDEDVAAIKLLVAELLRRATKL